MNDSFKQYRGPKRSVLIANVSRLAFKLTTAEATTASPAKPMTACFQCTPKYMQLFSISPEYI